tara:strand:- start:1301 stop:2332 length:1032 start_codon:yes stop_codon:yes gene_type:complete
MAIKKINIAIAGATGFVGLDLVKILSKHPNVNITNLCATKNLGKNIQYFDKKIKKKLPKITNLKKVNWSKIDVLFLSLPNGEAQKIVKKLIRYKKIKFIDLSADFRIKKPNIYKAWYGINHSAKNLIKDSIYSISEFSRDSLKKYRIISNPGCYPTSIQLALMPLIKKNLINNKNIIIDSKSGYSGAGKNFKKKFRHKNFFSSIHAYKTNMHRHMSELDQEFNKIKKGKVKYSFNPHILPFFRGLLSSIHLELKKNIKIKTIHNTLKKFHKKNKFIKIISMNKPIGTGNVVNTNFCEISVCQGRDKNRIVIFSAIDNLIKGASGQAVQNMNLLFNFKESTSLK